MWGSSLQGLCVTGRVVPQDSLPPPQHNPCGCEYMDFIFMVRLFYGMVDFRKGSLSGCLT